MFPDFLDDFEAFWYNKLNKYGVLRVQKSRDLDVKNNDIGILLYQSEADYF